MKKWTDLKSPYDWERDSKFAGWMLVISVVELIIFGAIAVIKNNPLIEAIGVGWAALLLIRYWIINRLLGTTVYRWKEHQEKMKKRAEKKRLKEERLEKISRFPDWVLEDQEKRYVLKLGKSLIKSVDFCGYETIDGIALPANVGTERVWDSLNRTSHKEIDVCEPKLTTVIAKAQFMTRWEATLAQKEFGGQIRRVELCDPGNAGDVLSWRPEMFD